MSIDVKTSKKIEPSYLRSARQQSLWSALPSLLFGAALLASDLLAVLLTGAASSWLALRLGLPTRHGDPAITMAYAVAAIALLAVAGSYRLAGRMPHEELQRLALAITGAFVPLMIAQTFLTGGPPLSESMWWLMSVVAMFFTRWIVRKLFTFSEQWRIPSVVIADEQFASAASSMLRWSARSEFRTDVLYSFKAHESLLRPLVKLAATARPRTAILIFPGATETRVEELAGRFCDGFESVVSIPAVSANSEVWFDRLDHGLVFRAGTQALGSGRWPQVAKRVFDIVVASVLLIGLLPIFLLIGVAIWLDSGGPVFYSQRRIGRMGGSFEMLKFRTMYPDAEILLTKHLDSDIALRREWDLYQKLAEDPRITRVGGLLRKLSLDELPQVINVIRGDMSLVGPRPMFSGQEPHYGPEIRHYSLVRPGLTGLWQISGRNRITFKDRAWLDTFYVRNASFWLDTYILLKTPLAVLRGTG